MPLFHQKHLSSCARLGLWRVEESIEELKTQLLQHRPSHEIPEFKSEARTREWLAARVLAYSLLQEIEGPHVLLKNLETGAPVCSDTAFHVSLTHSGPWVGALVSTSPQIGIDIELLQEKVMRLAPRFLNATEVQAAGNDLVKTHLYWSAKETLYKLYRQKELFFRENLLLQDFELQPAGTFKGQILTPAFNQTCTIYYEVHSEFVITYVLTA